MTSAEEIAALLGGKPTKPNEWMARCPTHNDRTPSLSIGIGGDGQVVVHYHAGCAQRRVISAINQMGHVLDGVAGSRYKEQLPARRVVARYDYEDENGHLAYQIVREERRQPPYRDWGCGDL
jgi:hypothetical protein